MLQSYKFVTTHAGGAFFPSTSTLPCAGRCGPMIDLKENRFPGTGAADYTQDLSAQRVKVNVVMKNSVACACLTSPRGINRRS